MNSRSLHCNFKGIFEGVSVWQQARTCGSCDRLPQKRILSTHSRSSGQSGNDTKTLFFPIPRHLSPVVLANATIVSFVLLLSYRSNFHLYTQREPTPNQKSARKCCDLSRLFTRNITKGTGSCKPASLNCPVVGIQCCRLCTFVLWGKKRSPRAAPGMSVQ